MDCGGTRSPLNAPYSAHARISALPFRVEYQRTGLAARKQNMKTKAKIVCHAGGDYNTTAAKLLIMAGQLMAEVTPDDATPGSREAARQFVDGVLGAAVSGGYTKADLLRDALGSSQRSNRLAVMAHDACKAAGYKALANLIGGVPG